MFEINCVDQNGRSEEETLLVDRSIIGEIDLVIVDFMEAFFEGVFRYFGHCSTGIIQTNMQTNKIDLSDRNTTVKNSLPGGRAGSLSNRKKEGKPTQYLHRILSYVPVFHGVDIARNHAEAVGARILSTRAAVHAHTVETRGWFDRVDTRFVRIVDPERRNAPPAVFGNISQVFFSAEDRGLLVADALAGSRTNPEGTVDFEEVGPRLGIRKRHVKGVARSQAAAAHEGKVFLGFCYQFLPVVVSKVRFRLAAEEFLPPSPPVVSDLHRIAGFERLPHDLRPAPVHYLASRR